MSKKSVLFLSFFSLLVGTNSNTQTISLSTKSNEKVLQKLTTHASHPSIPGFEYSYGFLEQLKSSRAEGYFYYDLDVYFSQFTDVSRLYLIHVSSNFTPGSIAAYNGESNFDAGYNLWSGYIHIYADQQIEGEKRSSSFTYIKSWPESNSDQLTSTVTTSFGGSYCIDKSFEAGVKLPGGVSANLNSDKSLTLSAENAVSIYGPEPTISSTLADGNKRQNNWSFYFNRAYHGSFKFDAYYMFELKNDAVGYQDYSFKFKFDIRMTNTARVMWWDRYRDVDATYTDSYGLY